MDERPFSYRLFQPASQGAELCQQRRCGRSPDLGSENYFERSGTRITPYKVTVGIPAFTSKEKKELADLTVSAGEKWVGELSNRNLKALFSMT